MYVCMYVCTYEKRDMAELGLCGILVIGT